MKKLILREFQKGDRKMVEELIMEAWHYRELCSEKTAKKLARVFLSSCLANQTYTQVAVYRGAVVGVIMGKNRKTHRRSLKNRTELWGAVLALLWSREGRKVSGIFSGVSQTDRQLLAEAKKEYEGELAFFVVSKKARGKGVGKELFLRALGDMEEQGIREFYLYTDTSCNFGFYEHQGMKRRCSRRHVFEIQGKPVPMEFFLYDGKLPLNGWQETTNPA